MADQSIKDLAYRTAASVFGGPVDLATMVMRPFGYNTPDTQVFGSSEYIGKKMEDVGLIGSARSPLTEFIASVAFPMPGSIAAKGAALAAPLIGGMLVGKNAKTWDALAAQKAKMLADMGTDSRTIWQQTGTWKGSDGKWRQNIDNSSSPPFVAPQEESLRLAKAKESSALPGESLDEAFLRSVVERGMIQPKDVTRQEGMISGKVAKTTAAPAQKIVPSATNAENPESVRLFHAGTDPTKGGYWDKVPEGGLFNGFFALPGGYGNYGTGAKYYTDINKQKLLSNYDLTYEIPYKKTERILEKITGIKSNNKDFDLVFKAVAGDESHKIDADNLMRIFSKDNVADASWEAQRLRGNLAKKLGYDAVEMSDENGISYLIVNGTKLFRDVN